MHIIVYLCNMESNVVKGAAEKQINRTFQNSWLDEEIFKG